MYEKTKDLVTWSTHCEVTPKSAAISERKFLRDKFNSTPQKFCGINHTQTALMHRVLGKFRRRFTRQPRTLYKTNTLTDSRGGA